MGKRKKPTEWTTDEALKRLFPKPVVERLKDAAHATPKPAAPRRLPLLSPRKKA